MKKEVEISKEELMRRKKSMRILKTLMIILDVFAFLLLLIQIKITKEVTYFSYVVLIICNIITFMVKIDSNEKEKSSKK